MGIRQYNPVTAGRRGASVSDFAELTKGAKPEKSLLRPLRKKGGRNNQGRITVRHRGGGHKQQYRLIDFKREKDGVSAKVVDLSVCGAQMIAQSGLKPHQKVRVTLTDEVAVNETPLTPGAAPAGTVTRAMR